MRHYIAIDGGNSKTDVVVGAEDGSVLAFNRGPGSSPDHLGVAGSIEMLGGLVTGALAAAGVTPDLLVAYLAGVDLPIEVERYSKAVGDAGWAACHVVDNDLFALLRAGTDAPDAIAVICGAGINCVGRRADGRTARFPALGQITGDWGGGHHLAQLAMWHAARGEDGRGPVTALADAVAAHFGCLRVEEVAAAMHLGELAQSRIDELAPLLFDVADAGDEIARKVVQRQADEIVAYARVAATRLELRSEPHHVVLGGGVLAARRPLLHNAVVTALSDILPQATVDIVTDRPVIGAALAALDHWHTPGSAVESAARAAIRRVIPR